MSEPGIPTPTAVAMYEAAGQAVERRDLTVRDGLWLAAMIFQGLGMSPGGAHELSAQDVRVVHAAFEMLCQGVDDVAHLASRLVGVVMEILFEAEDEP